MKRALVTGGSGTIGAAICRELGASGHYVYVHAHAHIEKARLVAAQIVATGGCAEAVRFDVTDALETCRALNSLLDAGAVQILINYAGSHDDVPLVGMQNAHWSGVIDVVLHGCFNVTQPLLMPMIRTHWGRIVNGASDNGGMM